MQSWIIRLTSALLISLTMGSCYRSTGVAKTPVSAFTSTSENIDTIAQGLDRSHRIGDYVLQSGTIQAVFADAGHTSARNHFGAPAHGAMIEFATRFVDIFSRTQTRPEDGINQIGQGVNLSSAHPIQYTRVEVDNIDGSNSSLILQGRVLDLDHSFRDQGLPVDALTNQLSDCNVTTFVDMQQTRDLEDGREESVFFLRMTSVVQNLGTVDLPIFTVNDQIVTTRDATTVFIPYPGWGFNRPQSAEAIAYSPFLLFQPRQDDAAFYSAFSQLDALVSARSELHGPYEHTMVGKVGTPEMQLAAGGELTFVREWLVLSSTAQAQNAYSRVASFLTESESPWNLYQTGGSLSLIARYNGSPGGRLVTHAINESLDYFNGREMVTLAEGETFPLFGVASNDANIFVSLPLVQVAIEGHALNSESVWITEDEDVEVDEEGNETTVTSPIIITEGEIFQMEFVDIGEPHSSVGLRIETPSDRRLFGRVKIEPSDGSDPISTGDLPTFTQGPQIYVNAELITASIPKGLYKAYVSRGPFNNINIVDVSIQDETDEEGNTTTVVSPTTIAAQLSPVFQLNGYLSADFDVRTAPDPLGVMAPSDMIRFAYAEDLDVVFFTNAAPSSFIDSRFTSQAAAMGGFDSDDVENDVDSLFDELVPSRAAAAVSAPSPSFPSGSGRYGMLNLPSEETHPMLEMPLVQSDPAAFYDQVRAIDPDIIIQLMRPRSTMVSSTGLFATVAAMNGLATDQPISSDLPQLQAQAGTGSGTGILDFDVIEVLPGNHYDEYLATRGDWFGLLNEGIFKPATGGSAGVQTKDIPIGAVRTFVAVDNQTIERDYDLTTFWSNLRAGQCFVTNGPIIDATVNGTGYGGRTTSSSDASVSVRISAAPWVPVQQLRIIVDGEVVETREVQGTPDSEIVRFDETIQLTFTEGGSHWVVVEAGAPLEHIRNPGLAESGTFGILNPGHVPIAFTNPIFVDVSL